MLNCTVCHDTKTVMHPDWVDWEKRLFRRAALLEAIGYQTYIGTALEEVQPYKPDCEVTVPCKVCC